MQQYKLRQIVSSNSSKRSQEVKGLTIPGEIVAFYDQCFFTVDRFNINLLKEMIESGSHFEGIIALSGCNLKPSKKEVDKYEFGDCRA